MSFITKRERVFNEYVDPFDLPARNEGKLKAYSSCTDTRAWSHFSTDQTEHLVEVIKRNNEVCRGKYVPVNVIVEMMMSAKNAEIERLKRKVTQLEEMLAVFDELELSCEQKCEIAAAHAMIKAANRSLDELALDLDISNFTEGIDSDRYQTGKSIADEGSGKGDEWSNVKTKVSKAISHQGDLACICDASTSAHDVRVDELKEALIYKDAKLSAMKNTIAVMENDVCEPYCIYAHIYTALEKIFATLRQNDKYRLFLDLMSSGKDILCVDIKAKILFKLKILEKFSIALLAPCSERFKHDQTCECYIAQVEVMRVESTFALTPSEAKNPIDSKRAQLVADIMQNEEMKEIISKDNFEGTTEHVHQNQCDPDQPSDFLVDNYSIDGENINRLKNLQHNYDDLMTCYENVQHERDSLKLKCQRYDELEEEVESMRRQIREYKLLYSEREYFRKRSEDLDGLKEQYLVLADETTSLETQLKAEAEINSIKSETIEDLRMENIALEKKLNDYVISFEKDKNTLECKLKEADCKIMCQDQQIRSLSVQLDRILEQDYERHKDVPNPAMVMDEIEALKEQIRHLKDSLCCSEEEKQQLQAQFEGNLKLINTLKLEIDDWKSTYEKTLQRNMYLEKHAEDATDEVRRLAGDNRNLSKEVEDQSIAVANLLSLIHNKSTEVNKLMGELEAKRTENKELNIQIQATREKYGSRVLDFENEKQKVLESLQLSRQESQELLERVKDYDILLSTKDNIAKSLEIQTREYNDLKNLLLSTVEENKKLKGDLDSQENNNSIMLQEIQRLRDINISTVDNLNVLQTDKQKCEVSLELTKKESEILQDRLKEFEELREQMQTLRLSHEKLSQEKINIESELQGKFKDLDDAIQTIEVTKKESKQLLEKIHKSENLKEDMIQLSKDYHQLVNEKNILQKEIIDKNKEIDNFVELLTKLKMENEEHKMNLLHANSLENELLTLKKAYDDLTNEKGMLQSDFDNKTEEINNLYNTLEQKIEENRDLLDQIKVLQQHQLEAKTNIAVLQDVNKSARSTLELVRRESVELINKLKNHDSLRNELDDLKKVYHFMVLEKEKLEDKFNRQSQDLKKIQEEKQELERHAETIMAQNENLEKALIDTRNELVKSTSADGPLAEVIKEIDLMKNEKIAHHKKIRELLDKLDETENIIADLQEDVLARDDRIAILENHINSLEDEVRQLHKSLAQVVTTGEEIKDTSYQKLDETLNRLEAHHSKATHNMKMELARLNNENAKLEEQLSLTRIKSEESFRDRHKYVSQIIHLQNEREIIATEIKQLELNSVGDTILIPLDCTVEDVLRSLDRIRKCLDAKHSKSNTLEQTLLKVQTSSQLLLSKADEAKKLVEKEKQKIINEKEEAIAARTGMEQQLLDLKLQLEEQRQHDKGVIKELEAEMLNQELIIRKFKESTEEYVAKLKDEIKSLQNLYQNSITRINELQERIQNLTEENDKNNDIINIIKSKLERKSDDVAELQRSLDALQNKSTFEAGVQVGESHKTRSADVQVNKSDFKKSSSAQTEPLPEEVLVHKDSFEMPEIDMLHVNKAKQSNLASAERSRNVPSGINEVQILTANVGNAFDFVSYIDYKLKQLSPGKLEIYSISGSNVNIGSNIEESTEKDGAFVPVATMATAVDAYLVDIYNRPSKPTSSSKAYEAIDGETTTGTGRSLQIRQSLTKSSDLTVDVKLDYYSKSNFGSDPEKSVDKDLFLIYHDSGSSQPENVADEKDWMSNEHPLILAHAITLKPDKDTRLISEESPVIISPSLMKKEKNSAERQVEKTKLKIELPTVENDSVISHETVTVRSPVTAISSGSKSIQPENEDYRYELPEVQITSKAKDKESHRSIFIKDEDQSHHKLSRVDADFLLFKENKLEPQQIQQKLPFTPKKQENFGLEYILNTVKHEMNTSDIKHDKVLRKSQSDVIFFQANSSLLSEHNPLKLSSFNFHNSGSHTTNSYNSPSKSSEHSEPKSFNEQSVSVDINMTDYYEDKIKQLTKMLDNTERDYRKKLDAIKIQYDNHIKNILNDHNQGVKTIQNLHEEALQDIIKIHENEVENLRTMSIEALRKAEKLEKENQLLKRKMQDCSCGLNDEPIRISAIECRKRKSKCRGDTRMLTKTNVEAFNVKPKLKVSGPCSCSLDVNVSDTIRNIFEQVDVEQRKLAEHAYLKYIANKMMLGSVEALDAQELSFLHLKVCRTWKTKLTKEEALQKRIDVLESELLSKQRNAQQHIADLDRKVAEERRLLAEAREAVCRRSPESSMIEQSRICTPLCREAGSSPPPPSPAANTVVNLGACSCTSGTGIGLNDHQSAGDLAVVASSCDMSKFRRTRKPESRAVLAKLDSEERRGRKLYDEHPTRLRRATDRSARSKK